MEEVRIPSDRGALAGALWRGREGGPCIVIAHGFGLVWRAGLLPFVERFHGAGHSVLAFDYRHFGASDGEPRQLVNVARQLADWQAALAFARSLAPSIDPDRVALWGASLSGGHAIVAAARDGGVAAAIALVPFMDGATMVRALGPAAMLRQSGVIARDVARLVRGAAPVLIPLAGPAGAVAALPCREADEGYARLFAAAPDALREIAARSLLRLPLYRPIRHAARVRCPLLVQVAARDGITLPGSARRAARLAPRGELEEYGADHFGLYAGPGFEAAVDAQLSFLRRRLPLG
jgi:uncharacterized protein